MDLRSAFEPSGVTAVVGAGGKKSTLYALAEALERAVVTATVRIPPFEAHVERIAITDNPVEAVPANDRWPLGVVPGRDGDRDRYLGYETQTVDELAASTSIPILVKADGARTRWLKAPGPDEPQLPASVDLVVPVASVKIVDEPLEEAHVHRPDLVGSLLDRSPGSRIRSGDVATVLRSKQGGLKGVPPETRIVPLLNMVDDAELESVARDIAGEVLAADAIERVVLGRMDQGEVVDVVE